MPRPITRRAALRLSVTAAGAVATTLTFPRVLRAAAAPAHPHGVVRGEPTADKIGAEVLASGGNAVDAVVASALAAAVCSPAMTGIGGYGTAIMIASADGKKVVAIDANSAAPAAARADLFPLDAKGAEAAYTLVRDELRRNPTLLGLDRLLEAQIAGASSPDRRRDLELVKNLVHSHARRLARYRCETCGFRARQFHWHCPACGGWETYPPRRSEEFDLAP